MTIFCGRLIATALITIWGSGSVPVQDEGYNLYFDCLSGALVYAQEGTEKKVVVTAPYVADLWYNSATEKAVPIPAYHVTCWVEGKVVVDTDAHDADTIAPGVVGWRTAENTTQVSNLDCLITEN